MRLQVDTITASATPLSCRSARKAATKRSSLNATFSRSATGAVLWLMPENVKWHRRALIGNPRIFVKKLRCDQAGIHGIGAFNWL